MIAYVRALGKCLSGKVYSGLANSSRHTCSKPRPLAGHTRAHARKSALAVRSERNRAAVLEELARRFGEKEGTAPDA
jgi:hypothetical protein